jgi:hypothetical protein
MGQAWKTDIQIVEVRTDDYVRGLARKEYWAAAAAPEQAMMLVLAAVPDGWTVSLSESPARKLPAGFKLEPGETKWVG